MRELELIASSETNASISYRPPRRSLMYNSDQKFITIRAQEERRFRLVLSVSKVLSNERGQARCHLAGEKELFGALVYMHLLNRYFQLESLV